MYNYINDLNKDKQNLINKYSLVLNDDLIWEFNHTKYFKVKYFSHKFAIKHSTSPFYFIYINFVMLKSNILNQISRNMILIYIIINRDL